jgi:hypothetical protein
LRTTTPKCAHPSIQPNLTHQTLFDQIESAVEYADAGKRPYNPDQVVSRAYLLLLKTGLYSAACRDWRRCAIFTQNWPNVKAGFAEAHRDLRIIQTAAHAAGYQSANAAMDDLAADYRRETTQALDHLATATAADRTAVANITQANTSLSTQLGTATTSITAMKQLIGTLQIQLCNLSPPSGSATLANHMNGSEQWCANK